MRTSSVVIAVLGVAAVASSASLAFQGLASDGWRNRAALLDDHCALVKTAMRLDARDLRNPESRSAAAARFLDVVAMHSAEEVRLCAREAVDISARESCLLRGDYDCLAKIADAAERAIAAP